MQELPTQTGPWQVEGFLAEGGMARLWRVRHSDGRIGALKVSRSRDPDLLARAAREGRLQAALVHPNIVRALDVIDVDGTPGIVLELVEGGHTLEAELRAGSLPPERLERLVAGLLDGVEAAHRAGVIHRDLKPANVLLEAGAGEVWVPRLCDFGLARPEFEPPDAKMTRAGFILGSAAYMAPEQARDAGSVDARADIWSLGAMLYEMVAGVPAFEGDTLEQVLLRVTRAHYRPLDAVRPGVPARWEVAVEACLHVDPAMRVPDVATLREVWAGRTKWVSEGGGARRRSIPGVASPVVSHPPRSNAETFVAEGEPGPSVPPRAASVPPAPTARGVSRWGWAALVSVAVVGLVVAVWLRMG